MNQPQLVQDYDFAVETPGYAFAKRALDVTFALAVLIILLPLLVVIGLLVKLETRGPIIHRRRAVGKGGVAYDCLKFRTMIETADEVLARDPELRNQFYVKFKLKADPRVTRIGRILRRASLDELPQFYNILIGEMSLVGPRPVAPDEVARYGPTHVAVEQVLPGLTGLWQISGRQDTSYEERIKLDLEYLRDRSFTYDLLILARTPLAVLRMTGAL